MGSLVNTSQSWLNWNYTIHSEVWQQTRLCENWDILLLLLKQRRYILRWEIDVPGEYYAWARSLMMCWAHFIGWRAHQLFHKQTHLKVKQQQTYLMGRYIKVGYMVYTLLISDESLSADHGYLRNHTGTPNQLRFSQTHTRLHCLSPSTLSTPSSSMFLQLFVCAVEYENPIGV